MSQVGGSHYEDMAIQPWEIIERNNLDFWEGNIIKYVLRHRAKNGVEDLMKAQDYLSHLINLEVGKLESAVPPAPSEPSDGLDLIRKYRDSFIYYRPYGDAVHVPNEEDE